MCRDVLPFELPHRWMAVLAYLLQRDGRLQDALGTAYHAHLADGALEATLRFLEEDEGRSGDAEELRELQRLLTTADVELTDQQASAVAETIINVSYDVLRHFPAG